MRILNIPKKLRTLLFPPKCLLCGALIPERSGFCDACRPEIPWIEGKVCEKCGIPLSEEFPSPICGRCREMRPRFIRNVSLMEHKGDGRRALLAMKYRSKAAAVDLSKLLSERLTEEGVPADVVTYVPVAPKEAWKKEFPVTRIMAGAVAKERGLTCKTLLKKVRMTEKQKELTAKQRVINVHGAYAADGDVKGKTVLLVDDVFTTGATLNECARVLTRAGATVYTATISIRDRL